MEVEKEIKEPIAPTWEMVEEAWTQLQLGGSASFTRIDLAIDEVKADLKEFNESEDANQTTRNNIEGYLKQLENIKEGMVASKNLAFMEGHYHAIQAWKEEFGEESALPVYFDNNGVLKWANRSQRRG